MTTKELIHALVERLDESDLTETLVQLQAKVEAKDEATQPRRLAWMGMGDSGATDLGQNHDKYLRETGFGEC